MDEAWRVAERGDIEEMNSIEPLLRLAYKMLQIGIGKLENVGTDELKTNNMPILINIMLDMVITA